MTDCIFRSLVLHAFTKIWGGDACDLCVVCFGAEHAQPALEKKKKKRGWLFMLKIPIVMKANVHYRRYLMGRRLLSRSWICEPSFLLDSLQLERPDALAQDF